MNKLFNVLAVVLAGIWTLFIITMVNLVGIKEERLINQIAMSQAQSLFQIMVDMRTWTAHQGGVYVVPSEDTPPNPYLNHPQREVVTTDGQVLTLVNPAYMTRQVSDIGLERRGVKTHITSLNPIRPENKALDWEKTALETFEEGQTRFFELTKDPEDQHIFRYMEPLALETACMDCHPKGHSTSSIRGGISIAFPVQELVENRTHVMRLNRTAFVSVWLMGLFAIGGITLVLEKLYPAKGKIRF
jgi:hypothetical protein